MIADSRPRTTAELHPDHAAARLYRRVSMWVFILAHLVPLGALVTGVTVESVQLAVALYLVRMFAITAGYHRYFSHRSFQTSRVFAALLAAVAQSSFQRGALWWAAHHRWHHKHSDDVVDVHSPVQRGFWYSHVGWLFDPEIDARQGKIRDLAKVPELVWLDRYWLLPGVALAVFCLVVAGWPGLWIGFFASTVALWHGTFTINSLCHVWGSRRYRTTDQSRNNLWLALLTLGEGWHNNHHYDKQSCRQGFFWWEIDVTYGVLRALALVGVVWNLRAPRAAAYTLIDRVDQEPAAMADAAAGALAALQSAVALPQTHAQGGGNAQLPG